jgi:uncharacterized membrane protein YbhN (UPF0104 family)
MSASPLAGGGRARWLGGGRSPLTAVLLYVVVALAAGAALALAEGDDQVARRLHDFHPVWLLVCLGGEALAYLGYVFALRETARVDGGPQLSFAHTLRVVAAGFGAFFAASASGGFEIDYLAFRHAGATPAALAAAMILTFGEAFRHPALTFPWLLVVPGFAAAFWCSSPKRAHRFHHRDNHNVLRRGVGHAVAGLCILRGILSQPFRHGLAFAGVALYWFGDLACLWAALMTFGAHVDVLRLLLAYATGYVVSRRGLPAGGVGVAEVLLTFAFVWFGVPFAPALLAVFGYRIFNLWLALLPAYAVQPTVARLRQELRETRVEIDRRAA